MSLRWRIVLVGGLVFLMAYLTGANFVPEETRRASAFLPDSGLRLGLDLKGGIHWVLGARLDVAVEHELDFLRSSLEEQLAEEKITPRELRVEAGRILVEMSSDGALARLRELVGEAGTLRMATSEAQRAEFVLDSEWEQQVRDRGMRQILEVLRRRIDDPVHGIPDSVVTRQGKDRVLVQIPGGQIDRSRARDLLAVTGFLEFKIVKDQAQSEELLRAKYPDGLPEDHEVVFEIDRTTKRVLVAYLVKRAPDLTGEYLADARVGFDRQQRPIVNFQFNPAGGTIFQKLTEENIGQQLAISLDSQIYSAPVIQDRIGSRGQITGRFSSQQAADLAVVLRSGSLAVPVVIEEERTVGPALGADSIDRGLRACIAGLLLIVAFSVAYYRLSGGYASLALLANLVMIIGLMSLFAGTLTLPGLAGLVLTVGMATDANVIIFERIREELRQRKTPRAAISTGFNKALWTILDANITTLITAIVLFEYGTGPIKGFAVTLSVGIVTSVFAAMVITRLLFAVYPGGRHLEQLSI